MNKVTVGFRVDPAVKEELLSRAQELGVSLSDLCETAILNNRLDRVGEGHLLLSGDDLENIRQIISEELGEYYQDELEEDWEDRIDEPIERSEGPLGLLDRLSLSDPQRERLLIFVNEAREHLEGGLEEALAKMLLYAAEHLRAKPGGFFSGMFVGEVE